MEKSYKICLHFVKFFQKLPAAWNIFAKSFIVLGFNLMFSGPEHRFLPLNLDWNPKSFSEGKRQQRKLKFNFQKKTKNSLQMYLKIELNTSILRKPHRKNCKKNLNLTVFTWLASKFRIHPLTKPTSSCPGAT